MIDFGFGVKLGPVDPLQGRELMGWRNKYTIRRWCRQYDLIAPGNQVAWHDKIVRDPNISMYSIVSGDKTVGVCGLTDIDQHNRKAEFSIYVEPGHMGKGLGKTALQTLICHGFANLGLNRIWGETIMGNPAAGLYGALGFEFEGRLRESYFKAGKMVSSEIWSILESEWAKKDWCRREETP